MKIRILVGCCLGVAAATGVHAGPAEEVLDELIPTIEAWTGGTVAERYCSNESYCEGFIGNEQFIVMWPENGWLFLRYLPFSGEDHLAACSALIEYGTSLSGLEAETFAAMQAGAALVGGQIESDLGRAEVIFDQSISGNVECEVRLPDRP